ncbi:MAG: MFS transporter [Steroidobacteraceae bacterium]
MNAPPAARSPGSWYVLGLLTLVYGINIADRFVVSQVLEPIRLELALSDAQVAFITGVALALFYVTVGIPVALLADRANRRNIIAIAVALWSAMTAACGVAQNVWQFVLGRFGVGIGESGGTAPSTSLLADRFPPQSRPAAFTIFALGAPLGAWLGSEFAGAVAQRYGWRAAFLALGVPGLVIALLVWLTIREPARGGFDATGNAAAPALARQGLWDQLRYLAGRRAFVHITMGVTVATLWGWGLLWWTPTFLMRMHGIDVGAAGAVLGPMHLIGGTLATLVTSVLVGPRAAADPRRVLWLLAGVLVLATLPSFGAYWVRSLPVAVRMLWLMVPAIYFFIGPTIGLMQNVVPPSMRALAMAVGLFTANVANLIIAPQAVGLASDWLAPTLGGNAASLRVALLVLAPTGFWAAYHYWAAARTIRAEQAEIEGAQQA